MAKTLKAALKERIENVARPEKARRKRIFKFWPLIPAVLVVGAGAFFVVRRVLTTSEK